MRARAVGWAAFAGAAVGGAALGFLAERRAMSAASGSHGIEPTRGRPATVTGRDGTRLHAEVAGPDDAPTIVFLHGVGLSSATWHYQREALADRFRVVAYDHRGHGGSETAADCSVEAIGHDLAAVVEQCGGRGETVVVGHSMGGIAILSMARQEPGVFAERVAGAVLCNTTAAALVGGAAASSLAALLSIVQARLSSPRLSRAELLGGRDPSVRPSSDLSFLLTRQFGMTRDASPDLVAFLEGQFRATPPAVLAAFAPGLANLDLREAAERLRVPSLVVVGERDRVTPPRQGRRLAELLGDSSVLELEGIGHTAMLEAPEAVTDAIARFTRSVVTTEAA